MDLNLKNIVGVSWSLPPNTTPRAVQISRLAKGLKQNGISLHFVTSKQTSGPKDKKLDRFYKKFLDKNYAEPILGKRSTEENSWIHYATQKTLKLITKKQSPIFITFAQPWSDHLIGLAVKNKTNAKWIAHFSDPWTDSPYYDSLSAADKKKSAQQEKSVVENADALIFVTQATLEKVMSKYSKTLYNKAYVIPHMLDMDINKSFKKRKKSSVIRIVHTGNFYGDRSAKTIVEAIKQIKYKKKFEFHFVGCEEDNIQLLVQDYKLDQKIFFHPHQGYFSSLNHINEADVCCVIELPTSKTSKHLFLPSKIFDYLSLGKPFFSLTPDSSELKKIGLQLKLPVADPKDIAAIRKIIENILTKSFSSFRPSRSFLRQYDLATVTRQWIKVLEKVC